MEIFHHQHPQRSEGNFVIELRRDEVVVRCHWPFDLETEEWIDITNSFARDDYAHWVDDLSRQDTARVNGVRGGFLEGTHLRDKVRLEVSAATDDAPTRLALNFELEPVALTPDVSR